MYSYNRPAAKLDLFFYPTGNYRASDLLPVDLQLQLKTFVLEPRALTLPSVNNRPRPFGSSIDISIMKSVKSVEPIEDVPVVWCPTEQLAQQDLLAVLRLIHLGKVSVSDKTSMPSKTTIKAITPLLQGGDYYSEADEPERQHDDFIGSIKPFAWIMLVQAGGLASLDGKKLQLTKAGQKAMGAAPAKTLKAIWKKWLKTTLLDELRRTESDQRPDRQSQT
jgi:hypothetical protein